MKVAVQLGQSFPILHDVLSLQGIAARYLSTAISTIYGYKKTHGLDRGRVLCLRLHRHHFSPALSLLSNSTELVLPDNHLRNSLSNSIARSVTKPEEACEITTILLLFQINWVLHFVGSIARKLAYSLWPVIQLITL